MVGPVDFEKDAEYWQQDRWSGQFPVQWHIIKDVPNSRFRHILLENNENKPVTHSRDTQEVASSFKLSPLLPPTNYLRYLVFVVMTRVLVHLVSIVFIVGFN